MLIQPTSEHFGCTGPRLHSPWLSWDNTANKEKWQTSTLWRCSLMRQVFCIVGFPGSGKTTVARLLGELFRVASHHLPTIIRPLADRDFLESFYRYGRILPRRFDYPFLQHIVNKGGDPFILDNYPPHEPSLRILMRFAVQYDWRVHLLALRTSPAAKEIFFSFFRQVRRDLSRGQLHVTQVLWKTLRAWSQIPRLLHAARTQGIPVTEIDSSQTREMMQQSAWSVARVYGSDQIMSRVQRAETVIPESR